MNGALIPMMNFFVLKLKDKHAAAALRAYAGSVYCDDEEFAKEIDLLAEKAHKHPLKKAPD